MLPAPPSPIRVDLTGPALALLRGLAALALAAEARWPLMGGERPPAGRLCGRVGKV